MYLYTVTNEESRTGEVNLRSLRPHNVNILAHNKIFVHTAYSFLPGLWQPLHL